MTYTVSSGTLNLTQLNLTSIYYIALCPLHASVFCNISHLVIGHWSVSLCHQPWLEFLAVQNI